MELNRAYQAGDPVSMIDWRAYARTNQLIVREERKSSRTRVEIILEIHNTMEWPDESITEHQKQVLVPKLDVGARILLHLAYRHIRMGDQVDLILLDEGEPLHIRMRSPIEVLNYFSDWERTKFAKNFIVEAFKSVEDWHPQGHVRYWISDLCHGKFPEETNFFGSTKFILIHILSSLEVDTSWFEGSEAYFDRGSKLKEYKGADLLRNNQYRDALERWFGTLRKQCTKKGGHYIALNDASPLNAYASLLIEVASGRIALSN